MPPMPKTKNFFPALLLSMLLLLAQTTTTTPQQIDIGTVADFFEKIVPALMMLAIFSVLFGFIRNIAGKGGLK